MRRSFIFLMGLFVVFSACDKASDQMKVGDLISLTANIPEDGEDLEFIWTLAETPEESGLIFEDLTLDESGSGMSFTADVPGDYAFEVSVYQYNDEVSTQSFRISVVENDAEIEMPQAESPVSEEEDGVSDLLAEDEPERKEPVKWYEEEEPVFEAEPSATVSKPVHVEEKPATPPPPVRKKQKPRPGSAIPYDENRFTIQVASKKNLDSAKTVAARLIEAGYDAYIQKAHFVENDAVWFRVRVGSYENKKTAAAVAKTISEFQKELAWVDFVRYEH